jgi:ornithine--oxo-acid transaminase
MSEVANSASATRLVEERAAHNYDPLPVVIASGKGPWVTDVEGYQYLDCLAGYSALNFGHGHPEIVAAAKRQIDEVTLTSRAFLHDKLGPFAEKLGDLTGKDKVLPMNSGAEAVETAIKLARKWGYEEKGIAKDQANIIVAENNFHGRTTAIVGFSSDPTARDGFGPFTPGFRSVKYGDNEALEAAIDENTAAVLLEPIQGEAGVIVPPDGYLTKTRELCDKNNVLFMADEIQSGLGRTGQTFACDQEFVEPDVYILGKALSGGILPVSAVAANKEIMDVINPGEHGSTFGGNALACAVGIAVVNLLDTGEYQKRARVNGRRLLKNLGELAGKGIVEVRGRGLWAGIDIDPSLMTGHEACERLAKKGVLAKDTHGSTIRLAPPLVVEPHEIDWATYRLEEVLEEAGA